MAASPRADGRVLARDAKAANLPMLLRRHEIAVDEREIQGWMFRRIYVVPRRLAHSSCRPETRGERMEWMDCPGAREMAFRSQMECQGGNRESIREKLDGDAEQQLPMLAAWR
ncbi:MAG: hypothetical protein KGL59_11630 [Acidobacteriota bacterium]|nr:hypothetical protein [Acidobacteriota bacterium]